MMTRAASRIYIFVLCLLAKTQSTSRAIKSVQTMFLTAANCAIFIPDLQRYLNEHGLEDARVMTGVTKRQGGNRTVAQLKAEREQAYQQEVERPALYFGESSGSELRF